MSENKSEDSKKKKVVKKKKKVVRKVVKNQTPSVPLSQRINEFKSLIKEVFFALLSRDSGLRKMAFLFFLSLLGIIFVIYLSLAHMSHLKNISKEQLQEEQKELLKKQKIREQAEKEFYPSSSMGIFMLKLKNSAHVLKVAEVEITIECDQRKTCDFIISRLPLYRDRVALILGPVKESFLLSPDGKRKITKLIVKVLNKGLPFGEVKAAYFTRLIIN